MDEVEVEVEEWIKRHNNKNNWPNIGYPSILSKKISRWFDKNFVGNAWDVQVSRH